jgi:transposase
MPAPLPLPTREAIVRGSNQGLTYAEIASLLGVGVASVSRTLRRSREHGTVEPDPPGGGNLSPLRDRVLRVLKYLVEKKLSDATLEELAVELTHYAGIATSRSSVSRALQRLGMTRKKSPSSRRRRTRPRIGKSGARSAPSSPSPS